MELQWDFDEDEDAKLLLGEELFLGGLGRSLSKSRDQSDFLNILEDDFSKLNSKPPSDLLITSHVQNLNVNANTFTPSKMSVSSEPDLSPNYFNDSYAHAEQNREFYGQAYNQKFSGDIDVQEYTSNLQRLGNDFVTYGFVYLQERKNLKPFYVEYIRDKMAERVRANTLGFRIGSLDVLVEDIVKLIQADGRFVYDPSHNSHDVFWLAGLPHNDFVGQNNQYQKAEQFAAITPPNISPNGPYYSPSPPQNPLFSMNNNNNVKYHVTQQQQQLLQPYNNFHPEPVVRPPVPVPPNHQVHNGAGGGGGGGAATGGAAAAVVNAQGPFPPPNIQLPPQKMALKSTLLQERYDSVVKEIAEDIIVDAIRRLQICNNRVPFRVIEIRHSLLNRETLLKHWLVAAEASVVAIMKADFRLMYVAEYHSPEEHKIIEVFWLSSVRQPLIDVQDGWFVAPPPPANVPFLPSSGPSGLNVYGQPMKSLSVNVSAPSTSTTSSVCGSPTATTTSPTAVTATSTATFNMPGSVASSQSSPPLVPGLSALERINKNVIATNNAGAGGGASLSPPREGGATIKQITASNTQINRGTSPMRVVYQNNGQTAQQTIVVKGVHSGGYNGGLNKGGTSSTGGMTIIRQTSPQGGPHTGTVVTIPPVCVENVINSVYDTSAISSYMSIITRMATQFASKAIVHLENNHNKQPYLVANIRIAIAKSDFESTIAYRIPDQEEFLLDVIDTLREDERLLYASKNSENQLEGFWLNQAL